MCSVFRGSARASRAVVGALADHLRTFDKECLREARKPAREARALPGSEIRSTRRFCFYTS